MLTNIFPVTQYWNNSARAYAVRDAEGRGLGEFTNEQTAIDLQSALSRVWETHIASEAAYSFNGKHQSDLIKRYPNIIAHLICESLGYASPKCAANIFWNAIMDKPEYCEWVNHCYHDNARVPVLQSIQGRHRHHGYMSEFKLARAIVQDQIENDREPCFGLASWM